MPLDPRELVRACSPSSRDRATDARCACGSRAARPARRCTRSRCCCVERLGEHRAAPAVRQRPQRAGDRDRASRGYYRGVAAHVGAGAARAVLHARRRRLPDQARHPRAVRVRRATTSSTDPPFSRLDLVSCRNVLIYLGAGAPEARDPAVPLRARTSPGCSLLGRAETIGGFERLFAPSMPMRGSTRASPRRAPSLTFPLAGQLGRLPRGPRARCGRPGRRPARRRSRPARALRAAVRRRRRAARRRPVSRPHRARTSSRRRASPQLNLFGWRARGWHRSSRSRSSAHSAAMRRLASRISWSARVVRAARRSRGRATARRRQASGIPRRVRGRHVCGPVREARTHQEGQADPGSRRPPAATPRRPTPATSTTRPASS